MRYAKLQRFLGPAPGAIVKPRPARVSSAAMPRVELVRPLEEDWRDTLDGLARDRSWPTTREVARLGAAVAALSTAYNDPARARAQLRDAGAARLGFSFARDVPKGAAAVRELVATGALARPLARGLRVLDLGAGLGATTWGLVRALAAAGERGRVDATWVDTDGAALELAGAIVRARAAVEGAGGGDRRAPIELRVRTVVGPAAPGAEPPFDVILLGQVLSELNVGEAADARALRHAALVRELVEKRTNEGGALVVVEPALRDRTRHLHRVRDVLAAAGRDSDVRIFAPCLHAAGCPALERDADWCHEDLPVNLPPWLVPVARAAGLRFEGLTFSYLVLRRAGARFVDAIAAAPGAARLRMVSDMFRSKGKREGFFCGEFAGAGRADLAPLVPARALLTRLDRDEAAGNARWTELARGDVVVVGPAPDLARPRIERATKVEGAAHAMEHAMEQAMEGASKDAPDSPAR
jgi:SAM-dependent methyltransferase